MKAPVQNRVFSWIFGAAAVLAVFTGFGNMPLYRRYYIADLPGLGWTGDFMANLHVHYLAGSVLLGVAVYVAAVFFREWKRGARLTKSGALRAAVIFLVLASGLFMALRNLPGVDFPFAAHVGLNFLHMGAAVFFALIAVGCAAARCRWVKTKALR
jgi:hypothetical protein